MANFWKLTGPVRVLGVCGLLCLSVSIATAQSAASAFKAQQLKHSRVKTAQAEKEAVLQKLFEEKKLSYPPREVFFRAFKKEAAFEVWVRTGGDAKFTLLKTYSVCANSGGLGPKRREGDQQVPEGFYEVDRFNPVSQFYLSLGINYPNKADHVLGTSPRLGGDIFIHGNCVTLGCLPLTDDKMKEVYWLAVEAKASGQRALPVHIFPFRMTDENVRRLAPEYLSRPDLWEFWMNLKEGFDSFERNRVVPQIRSDQRGRYHVQK